MTWHSILSAFQAFAPCCEADLPHEDTSIFAFRGDGSFGLPLVSSFLSDLSEDFFDISTAEPAPQSAEPLM